MDKETETKLRAAFAAQLRAERAAADLTQKELGRRAGLSQASIIRYESGTRPLSVEALFDIGDVLGFTPRDFMDKAQARFEG